MRVATRLHANGWLSVVDERHDGDDLIACAVDPDGTTHRIEVRQRANGVRLGYDARKEIAQQMADQIVATKAEHIHCRHCHPWREP